MEVKTIASISNHPGDVIAAIKRGMPIPNTKINKRTVQRKIRSSQKKGMNFIFFVYEGILTKIIW